MSLDLCDGKFLSAVQTTTSNWRPFEVADDDPCSWACHPDCDRPGAAELLLIENRPRVRYYGSIGDDEASYSFENYALISLDDAWYLLVTSGCSCPSPTEKWAVTMGPSTLTKITAEIRAFAAPPSSEDRWPRMQSRQHAEFETLVKHARKVNRKSATGGVK